MTQATVGQPDRRARTAEEFQDQQNSRRRAGVLDQLAEAVLQSQEMLEVPQRIESIEPSYNGIVPTLPAEAFELARQVYYLQHGSVADAARAVIAAGLSDTNDADRVRGRLRVWWKSRGWPMRPTSSTFAIRDAAHDGGLYRSRRVCIGEATGSGPAPKGKPCTQSALLDSDYCPGHDPRPEYEEKRRQHGQRLALARRHDMVPIEPLQRFLDHKRLELLADARASGARLDPKQTGWGLLARATGMDASATGRAMNGEHNGGAARAGVRRTATIRAVTVMKYLKPFGVPFRDVYGFDQPAARPTDSAVCPDCGSEKLPQSETCRACHEASLGTACRYITRTEKRCGTRTRHPSGYCAKCRRTVERVPRPRKGRQSFLSVPMLMLALDEYIDHPVHTWVAARMWALNAGGVCDVFASQKVLAGTLVKQFAKRDVRTAKAAACALEQLVADHGPVEWPNANAHAGAATAGTLPSGPFNAWLAARHRELGSYAQLARRLQLNPDNVSRRVRGLDTSSVLRATVDRAVAAWGDGATFADIYTETAA